MAIRHLHASTPVPVTSWGFQKNHADSTSRFLVAGLPLAVCLALAPGALKAQTAGSPDTASSEKKSVEVVVTAPRIEVPLKENPAATTVVEEETIKKSTSKTIGAEEALKLVPGVKVDNQADGERVHLSIRGIGLLTERGIRGIKVKLDGLPLNDPTGFAPDLFDVDWATVQRIEVFRGPASALYGGGAAGGILNITTRDGSKDGEHLDGSLLLGTDGFWKVAGETAGATGPVSYRFSASRMMGDGYRDHTKYHGTNLYGKLKFQPSESTRLTGIVAGTGYFNENAEGLNSAWLDQDRTMANPDALTFNEYQRTRRFTAGLSGLTSLTPSQDLTYSVYYRHTEWEESVPSTVQHRTFDTPGASVQYTTHFSTGKASHHLSFGTDLDGQTIEEIRRPNLGGAVEGAVVVTDQTINQWSTGLYLMDRVEFGPEWGAMAGLRWDKVHNGLEDHLKPGGVDFSGDRDFDEVTGRVGITYNPTSALSLFAAWGQGFLPPATEELANNPDALGGFNNRLVPSTSQGVEAGARGSLGRGITYDVTLFYLKTKDDFGRYRVPGRPLETFYGNVGSTRRYGVETSAGWYPVESLSVQLAYTFADYKYEDIQSLFGTFSDQYMPNAPAHQLYLDLEYRPHPSLVIGASCELQTRSYVDATNLTWAGGYTLYHARAAYQFKRNRVRGEVTLAIRNIFDKEYIAFTEPDPDGNSYQPAPVRQVFGGVHVWF